MTQQDSDFGMGVFILYLTPPLRAWGTTKRRQTTASDRAVYQTKGTISKDRMVGWQAPNCIRDGKTMNGLGLNTGK